MTFSEELIQQCDQDIRNGRPQHVAKRLVKLNSVRVPHEWRLPLAKICRRAGLYPLGLSLLSPLIHNIRENSKPVSPNEIAEYSVLLMRSGAVSEAIEKLGQVDAAQAPEALLYQAYGLFLNWKFSESIPLLEHYIQTPLAPYSLLVGKANLAFALVEERLHERTLSLTEEIIKADSSEGHRQLQGTCHSIRAQVFIQERNFKKAREELQSAHELYALAQTNDHFLLTKWNLILEGLESNSIKPFTELRQLAVKFHDWEAYREADLFSLMVDFSRERLVHLYFGSPFLGFRKRMLQELGSTPTQASYVFGPKQSPRFDLVTGQIDGSNVVNPGKKIHQLFQVLARDFYRPLRIGGLFSELFPDEQFNISSSPGRVHQILRRGRAWLKENQIPVNINETDEYYSLNITGKFSFRIPLDLDRADSVDSRLARLRACCGEDREFTAKEARERLDLSEATIQRLIKWGLSEGRIEKAGNLKRTVLFKFTAKKTNSSAA